MRWRIASLVLLSVLAARVAVAQSGGGLPPGALITSLDVAGLTMELGEARQETSGLPTGEAGHGRPGPTARVQLPLPDGSIGEFEAFESPVMSPELQAVHPECRAYVLRGVGATADSGELGGASGRLEWTPRGLSAFIRTAKGTVFIDPLPTAGPTHYASYWSRESMPGAQAWTCLAEVDESPFSRRSTSFEFGPVRRTYRLSLACTAEYTSAQGGTSGAMAAMTTLVGRLNGVYESECAIRFVLVAGNDQLVFTDALTDPYTNDNLPAMLAENQAAIDTIIGPTNYDVGHVLGTTSGGVASIGVACQDGLKAKGVTGSALPATDPYSVQSFCHEIGHQFGARHTFNGVEGGCAPAQRSPLDAYEPGSGSTLMSYAGYCGLDNVIPGVGELYFHASSLQRIFEYVDTSALCAVLASTGNTAPTVDGGDAHSIPSNTPFELSGSAVDAEGDTLRYCWEQRDLGPAASLAAGDTGSGPLLRSRGPELAPVRTIPSSASLLANTLAPGEALPATTRVLHFTLTARDQRAGGGGTRADEVDVNVTNTAGPFRVTMPIATTTWSAGPHVIQWDVTNTDQAPVSTASVRVLFSSNNGDTWSELVSSVPNTGSTSVTIPSTPTSQARIRVEAVGNIFFDVSDAFGITCDAPTSVSASDDKCDRVTVTWNAVAGADSYSVWRGATPDPGSASLLGACPDPTFDDATIPTGSTMYYFVRSVASACTSALSTPDVGTRLALDTVHDVDASNGQYCDRVDIAWTPYPGATSYQVRRSTSNNIGNSVLVGSPATNVLSDWTALPGATYHYFVRASTPCGFTAFSDSNSGFRNFAPGAPTNLVATPTCGGTNLSWSAMPNTVQYEVHRATGTTVSSATLVGTSPMPSFTDATAPAGIEVRYWVRGVNVCGNGGFSVVPAIATRPAPPVIVTQPSGAPFCIGQGATLSVVATGTPPLAYAWTRDGAPIGDDSPSLTLPPLGAGDDGAIIRCTVSNACGSEVSKRVTLSVRVCGPTLFVDASAAPGGNGFAWPSAFQSLSAALAYAAGEPGVSEIRVAAGTYSPGTTPASAFAIPANVSVLGGFPGGGGDLASRAPMTNPTILSGDLLGDDAPDFVNRADNATHVLLQVASNAVLDGVVIRAGRAGGAGNDARGGGVLVNTGASLTLRRCWVVDNDAIGVGGGIAALGALTLDRTLVSANRAVEGGGVSIDGVGVIENTTISGNDATSIAPGAGGGGVRLASGGALTMRHATIATNSAAESGGGLLRLGGSLTLSASVLADNIAPHGPDAAADLGAPGGSQGGNIIRSLDGVTSPAPSDRLGRNPRLLPLAANADDFGSHSLARTSLAIDLIEVPCAIATDQRGLPRPVPGVIGGTPRCDAGAIEMEPAEAICFADLDNGNGVGTPDGGVDINDLIFMLNAFEQGSLAADLDDGGGTGAPDDAVDIADLVFFLTRFEQGC